MSDSQVDSTSAAQDATATDNAAPAPNPADPAADAARRAAERRDALRDAFLLGAGIIELKNRVQISLLKNHPASGLRLASVWRASFNRIAALQAKAFETSTTAQTLYEPPDQSVLPYLYPPTPDYADIGIVGGVESLSAFKLYDVTRRAINCLTLLYVKDEESLVPEKIRGYRERLVADILKAAQHPEAGGGDPNATEEISSPPQETALERAKAVLTERVVKFLDAWDGYLRENFYAGGKFQNDDLELVAYESGHSMSSFSWGIAAVTESLERNGAVEAEFIKAWEEVFKVQNVNRLQHQISALSSELDDAYYLEHPDVKRVSADAVLVAPNPDLPSQSIQAVKNSIDYWQRTVEWIPDNREKLRDQSSEHQAPWNDKLRLALAEQANIWQTLLTGQQTLRAYNMESVTHVIMRDVTTQIQNSLRTDFYGNLRRAEQAMKEVADEVKGALDTAKEIAVGGLETLFGSFKRYLLLAVGIAVAIFIVLFVLAWSKNNPQSGLGNLAGALISAVLGWFGLGSLKNEKSAQQTAVQAGNNEAKSKVDSQAAAASATGAAEDAGAGSNFLTTVQGAAQQTGTIILKALERGYEQARIELDSLSRSVAVSYPLVEFFGVNLTLEGDVSVLTEILWGEAQRDAEIERVTRAAFGPLSVFILPSGHDAKQIGGGQTD
ncbi:MAG TPA: hypothetical protein VF656_16575 [Pyrinomonadaceae bacterium]|jgi:hypothetical protein